MFNRLAMIALLVFGASNLPANAQNSFAVLAASWQPAFCERRADRPECASQTSTRYDATNFSLHGLWPRAVYCNIPAAMKSLSKNGRWGSLPDLNLDATLRSRLNQIMPGTRSFLQRHQWVKHGSCFEDGAANGYFEDSLRLMNELNASPVRQLFADNLGKRLDTITIQSAFDNAFGKGAGERIKVKCRRDGDRLLIREITIGLYGVFDENATMARLIQAAKPTRAGCMGGIIDPAGLQ